MVCLIGCNGETQYVEENLDSAYERFFEIINEKKAHILIKKHWSLMSSDGHTYNIAVVRKAKEIKWR